MAKLRMTYKNLKALRKSREYQALLVDLVSVGVVPKATAEGLLGYNIPANLITDDESSGTDDPIDEGGGSGTEELEAETPVITTDLSGSASLTSEVTSIDLTIVASVTDEGTLSYAWTKDGDVIPDATAATLTVNEAGTYQCTVTNTLGEDTATVQSTACVVTASAVEEAATATLLYFDATANDNAGEWETETFTLANDTTEADIIAAAKTAFEDNTIDTISFVELDGTYVEGTSSLADKYAALDPQPEAFANGQLINCFKATLAVEG